MTLPLEYEIHPQPPEKPHRPAIELFLIAAPTIAQMASYTLMQFIDTWMLSTLGTDAPTAAGNSGMLAFTLICFGLGVLSLVNTLVSQNYGARHFPLCGQYLWQGVYFALIFTALVLPTAFFAKPIMAMFGHAPELQVMEATYLQIVLLTCGVKLIGNSCAQFLLGVNHPTLVFLSSLAGVSVNIVAAAFLIFGLMGFPKMGVSGAAWAQNIGVTVEMLVLLGFILLPKVRRGYGLSQWQFHPSMFGRLFRLGIPAGVQFVGDLLAWTLFINVIMGSFGTQAMTAANFTFRWMSLSFMPAIGIGTAVTCLVGRYIGRGKPEIAIARTRLAFQLTSLYMVICGVGFFLLRRPMTGFFTVDPAVVSICTSLMIIAAIWQFFDAQFIIYSSALRGAGDTFAPAVALLTLNWSITIAGGYLISRHARSLGPLGPWYAAIAYGVILGAYCYLRFKAAHWREIRLMDKPAAE